MVMKVVTLLPATLEPETGLHSECPFQRHGGLQLEKHGGQFVFGYVLCFPYTGSYKEWVSVGHDVDLPAGCQEIVVKAMSPGWILQSVEFEFLFDPRDSVTVQNKVDSLKAELEDLKRKMEELQEKHKGGLELSHEQYRVHLNSHCMINFRVPRRSESQEHQRMVITNMQDTSVFEKDTRELGLHTLIDRRHR